MTTQRTKSNFYYGFYRTKKWLLNCWNIKFQNKLDSLMTHWKTKFEMSFVRVKRKKFKSFETWEAEEKREEMTRKKIEIKNATQRKLLFFLCSKTEKSSSKTIQWRTNNFRLQTIDKCDVIDSKVGTRVCLLFCHHSTQSAHIFCSLLSLLFVLFCFVLLFRRNYVGMAEWNQSSISFYCALFSSHF